MRYPCWRAAIFAAIVLCGGLTFAQGPLGDDAAKAAGRELPRLQQAISELGPELRNKVDEIAADLKGVFRDSAGSDAQIELASKAAALELSQATRAYFVSGTDNPTGRSFDGLVNQTYLKIRASLPPSRYLTPDNGVIFAGLLEANEKRWYPKRQKLTLEGDIIQVSPAPLDRGEAQVSLPKLQSFYSSALALRRFNMTRFDPRQTFVVH